MQTEILRAQRIHSHPDVGPTDRWVQILGDLRDLSGRDIGREEPIGYVMPFSGTSLQALVE